LAVAVQSSGEPLEKGLSGPPGNFPVKG